MNYPKILDVKPLDDLVLEVEFENKQSKRYDCKRLLKIEVFQELKNKFFFAQVQVDQGGYGISWNDNLDLAESELWLNGEFIER